MKRKNMNTTDWANVDEAGDEKRYINYLDGVTAIEAVQAYKRQTYSLMEIEEGHHVLDIGCGTGDDALKMAEMVGASGRVAAVDSSEFMINEAKKRAAEMKLPIEFRVGDIYHLDEADNVYDSCRADRVFQHLTNPVRALEQMIRVTRPGGRILVYDVDWETLVVDTPEGAPTRKIMNLICDEHLNGWSGRKLFRYFREAGLNDLVIVPATGIITNYALADQLFEFSAAIEALQKTGELSVDQATGWVTALKQADQSGKFFSSLSGYAVCGRKPA